MERKWFEYKSIPWRGETPPRGVLAHGKFQVFESTEKEQEQSRPFAEIVSSKARADYWSPSANHQFKFASDILWLRHAYQHKKFDQMSSLWWSCLIPSTGLLCSRKGTKTWWFVLGFDWAPCFMGVPAIALESSSPMRFKLQSMTPETLQYFFFYAPDEFEVVPAHLVAPLHLGAAVGIESDFTGIVFEADGHPATLLEWAARKAFYKLPKAVLNRIANKIGAVVEGTSLFDILVGLVRSILPALPEQELVRIIETRVADK
eukprot:6088965-Amphidinium_carterae.4